MFVDYFSKVIPNECKEHLSPKQLGVYILGFDFLSSHFLIVRNSTEQLAELVKMQQFSI